MSAHNLFLDNGYRASVSRALIGVRRGLRVGRLSAGENGLGPDGREQVQAARDHAGPAGLVTRAEACAVVAVKICVMKDAGAAVGVFVEVSRAAVDGPPAVLAAEENVREAPRDLLGDFIEIHPPARARGTFHGEVVAV